MKKIDSDYFRNLKQVVYSEDVVKVKQSFKRGKKLLEKSVDKFDLGRITNSGTATGKCVSLVATFAGVVVEVAGVVVAVVVFATPLSLGPNASKYEQEKLIAIVVERIPAD